MTRLGHLNESGSQTHGPVHINQICTNWPAMIAVPANWRSTSECGFWPSIQWRSIKQ